MRYLETCDPVSVILVEPKHDIAIQPTRGGCSGAVNNPRLTNPLAFLASELPLKRKVCTNNEKIISSNNRALRFDEHINRKPN